MPQTKSQPLELDSAQMRFLARHLLFHIREQRTMQVSNEKKIANYLPGGVHRKHCSSSAEADRIALRMTKEHGSRAYRIKLAEDSLAYFLEQLGAGPCFCDTTYDEKTCMHRRHSDSCFARPIE